MDRDISTQEAVFFLLGDTRRLQSDVCESERSYRRTACSRETKLLLTTTTTLSNTGFSNSIKLVERKLSPVSLCVVQGLQLVNISLFVTRFGVCTLCPLTVTGVNSRRMRDDFLSNCLYGWDNVCGHLSLNVGRTIARQTSISCVGVSLIRSMSEQTVMYERTSHA